MKSIIENCSFETVLAILGIFVGFVKSSQKVLLGGKLRFRDIVAQSIVSAFSCLMAGLLLKAVLPKTSIELMLFLSGMCGYLGVAGLAMLVETVFFKGRM